VSQPREPWQDFLKSHAEEWAWPPTGPKAEEQALMYNANRMTNVRRDPRLDRMALARMLKEYPRVSGLVEETACDDVSIMRYLLNGFIDDDIRMESKPGFPWVMLAADNQSLFAMYREAIIDTAVQRITLLTQTDNTLLASLSAFELLQGGFCDPVRVMVKNEPHTKEKLKKAPRIISCVSIVDSLLMEDVERWPCSPFSTDCSGHDWTVTQEELDNEAKLRCALRLDECPKLDRLTYNCATIHGRTLYCTSDGRIFSQEVPGAIKSGSYMTSSATTHIRVMNAYVVGSSKAMAMGDDCVEAPEMGLTMEQLKVRYLERTGKFLRHVSAADDKVFFEFCSHKYFRDPVTRDVKLIMDTWPKMLYKAISQSKDESVRQMIADTILLFTRSQPDVCEALTSFFNETGWAIVD